MFRARSYLELGLVPLLIGWEGPARASAQDQEPTRVSALTICYGLTKLSSLYCASVIGRRSPSKSLTM